VAGGDPHGVPRVGLAMAYTDKLMTQTLLLNKQHH
jgi:hypothetical protein